MVKASWIKKGAVVIDCGINSISGTLKKSFKYILSSQGYHYNSNNLLEKKIFFFKSESYRN